MSEPLNIHDRSFLIQRLIEQAPKTTMVREFFKNAEENAALTPGGAGKVHIYPVLIEGVRKLAFWNTGIGMSDTELRTATEISASINKAMGLDGNYGIGAKSVASQYRPMGLGTAHVKMETFMRSQSDLMKNFDSMSASQSI